VRAAPIEEHPGEGDRQAAGAVFLYHTNEMTMKEIGDVRGVNESRVSQIHKIALKKMATVLHDGGIRSAQAL
jgi:RNA polymerase sigma factor for flagellar operon FliA